MAKFKFPLDAVLRARQHAEHECQRAFAIARGALESRQSELAELDAQAKRELDDLRTNHLVGTVDLSYVAAYRRYSLAVQKRGVAAAQAVAAAHVEADAAHGRLAEAAKQRKVIEKLRERQFHAWRAEQSRKELEQLDEAAMQLAYSDFAAMTDAANDHARSAR